MEEFTISNKQGLSLKITRKHPENYQIISGGRQDNPTFEEYLSELKPEFQQHFILVREGLEKLGWIGETAESKSNYYCFVFSDGLAFGFTWRGWGDFMQAIVGKREGYMMYYM